MPTIYREETGTVVVDKPETRPEEPLRGWLQGERGSRYPVLWDHEKRKWFTAKELEAHDRSEEAFALRRMDDPQWGMPWNYGVTRDPYD